MQARTLLLSVCCFALLACRPRADVPPDPTPHPAAEPEITGAADAPKTPDCTRRSPGTGPRPLAAPVTGSTLALARAGDHLLAYVADDDERALRTIDIDAQRELSRVSLDARPSALLLAPDGRIFVALRDRAALQVFEPHDDLSLSPTPLCRVHVATEPVGLAATPDGTTLLVTSRWGASLAVLRMDTLTTLRTLGLARDPQAVITSADGKKVWVSHVAGARLSVVDLGGAAEMAPRIIATTQRDHTVAERHFMPSPDFDATSSVSITKHDRAGTQGFALARTKAGRILLPQVMVETGPASGGSVGYGSSVSFPTVVSDISIIDDDEAESVRIAPLRATFGFTDCLLPRAAAVDEVGGEILVACLGIDTIVAYGSEEADPRRAEKRRWSVGKGPMGIALDTAGRRAVVFSQFDGTLDVLALGMPRGKGEARQDLSKPLHGLRIPLERTSPLQPTLALGRALFHEAGGRRIASDGRVCASCHPDGRDDALTWSTPEGPRQTPMLVGRLPDTGPYGWDGDRADLPSHFARTILRLGGAGVTGTERDALLAYIQSIETPDPAREHAIEEARIARGATLFRAEEVGCSSCHLGDALSTDRDRHDVKSAARGDTLKAFDTPSLRFIARSAPYFHDGRYPTLLALLQEVDGTMGHTSQLSPEEIAALGAYLGSL